MVHKRSMPNCITVLLFMFELTNHIFQFGESEITKVFKLDLPPQWFIACRFQNGGRLTNDKKDRSICFVPNQCCKADIRKEEQKQKYQKSKLITCGDSDLILPPEYSWFKVDKYVEKVKANKSVVVQIRYNCLTYSVMFIHTI